MNHNKIRNEIKTALSYPGGKSRAISQILPLIPQFKEYREPFIGGGSVFLAVKQRIRAKYVINDLNKGLIAFWNATKNYNKKYTDILTKYKNRFKNGKALWGKFRNAEGNSELSKAVKFFIMTKISYSGLADSGGFSQQNFDNKFSHSSINRLKELEYKLKDVQIYNKDYEEIVNKEGDDVFIFLDPPYYTNPNSKLYGKKGKLHTEFDHVRFADIMKNCNHKWLITYDDCKEVRDLFSFANIKSWKLKYTMNSIKMGNELFISNY